MASADELPPWMHEQVRAELSAFAGTGISPDLLAQAESYYRAEYHDHFVRYTVSAGRLHHGARVERFPSYIAERFDTVTAVLDDMAATLPDLDFIVYLGDGFDGWSSGCDAPVFAFSKRHGADRSALLMPDPLTLAQSRRLRRQVAAGSDAHPWESKADRAFWRGATTGGPHTLDNFARNARFQLVELARVHPDLIDAGLTAFHTCAPEIEALARQRGYLRPFVDIASHFRFRYQVLVDGFTSPWQRYFWAVHGNSLLMKQASDLRGWFDTGTAPWTHFVPLASDLSDLPERVAWARENDDAARQIVSRARQFAAECLSDRCMLGYLKLLLTEYARLLAR